jgi:hypothetical protein
MISNIQNIIPAGTVMNTTLTSTVNANGQSPVLQKIYNFSIQITFTGTPTGSFKLQASSDPWPPQNPNYAPKDAPLNWTDVANSTFIVTAAGNVMWDYSMCGFNSVRVVYTDTSGGTSTATITSATFNGK